MSKTTKIIAALGVVAGLGVAALPAFTYAQASVKGQVVVGADVQPAIAMTITGNNDGTGKDYAGVDTFTPSDSGQYIGSYDTTGKTAYDASSLQTSGSKTTILPNSLVEGDLTPSTGNGFGSTITVYTNDSGYTLTIQDLDDDNSLTHNSDVIPAVGTVTPTPNTLTAGSAAWGYKGGLITSWSAVPIDDSATTSGTPTPATTIKNGSGATLLSGDTTEVLYAVSTSATQPTGLYTDTIVYTATTAN